MQIDLKTFVGIAIPRRARHSGSVAIWLLLSILAIALTSVGCERQPQKRDGVYKAEIGRVPAARQRQGDPAKGREALLNRASVTCGAPYRLYRQALARKPAASDTRLAGRQGRNAELPYYLTATTSTSGVELVTPNCLGCHAALLDGEIIIGLGNAFLDMTQDPLVAVEATGTPPMSEAEHAEWRRWAERTLAIADDATMDTIGVSAAHAIDSRLMAHRDPLTLAWLSRPLMDPPRRAPVPLSVPPLWNLGKKHGLFYNAEGRGDHVRYMAMASLMCSDSVDEVASIDEWLVDVRAYLVTLKAPDYPYEIDHALADRGAEIFRAECEGCHGAYHGNARYPNLVVALGEVRTDPVLAKRRFFDMDGYLRWFQASFFGQWSQAAPALGYLAPPLDGIWATAPYLHNASVPNLDLLLDGPSRPAYWELDPSAGASPAYDRRHLGWAYRKLPYGKDGAMSLEERKRIYDTTQTGYGNGGHSFGSDLTHAERKALLEYLKTL